MIVAPSLLSADLLALGPDLAAAEAAGAGRHHFDVMDGHFVPNLSFGIPLLKSLRGKIGRPLEAHLMVANPDETAAWYVDAGADAVSFHCEAASDPQGLARALRQGGAEVGVAINPDTRVEKLRPLAADVDFFLVMGVHPGFSGQAYIPETTQRVAAVAALLEELGERTRVKIEVDGGVGLGNARELVDAGADILVTGSYLYSKPMASYSAAIRELHVAAGGHREVFHG